MKIADFFRENNINVTDKKLLVAASSGPDSMALLDMLKNLQDNAHFKLMAAHFNHQLRADSEEESKLLKKYCSENHVPLFIAKWPKEDQPKVGIEAAARHARYAFLTQMAKENNADYLLTAHHGDDLLENILLKFIRSGNPEEMNSLQMIGKMHGIKLLRPLLGYSKAELLQYNQEYQIDFVIDSTNQADETMRNRLRHHVVPLLKKENPALIRNALFFSQKMDELIDYVDEKNSAMGQLESFLNVAYRIKSEALSQLTEKERIFFWQRMIWQKYHRRVNENLGNFVVMEYQNYFYLYKKQNILEVRKQKINLNQPFVFRNRKMVLSTERKTDLKLIGDFWFKPDTEFSMGELVPGSKLLLKNGHHVKAKKKFAENAIPLALRPFCLAIYAENEPVFVEKIYQNKNWIKNSKHYFLYNS
ncbi:tRNA(Ile)-lysidine synthase [Lactobacillus helveticus]|uniref:tRNA lysidine(34) synthetase TilS n=1 Tax=Lactobacillus helveticus TaxID=1587 RepID=UPI0015622E59|nr:tRNA lysidine(34) synthetase TilS [Lactobacillus helveticus]NRO61767.1 tRNA(Ile)-lysidine synthase [Lactobacillus helveticus]